MITYSVRYSKKVIRELLYSIDILGSLSIVDGKNLDGCEDSRVHGKPLTANRSGL